MYTQLLLVVLCLTFVCFTTSFGHSLSKKTSAEFCTRLQSFSLNKHVIVQELERWLKTSNRTVRPRMIYHSFTSLLTRIKLYLGVYTSSLHVATCVSTVLVIRNFTKSADCPRRKSAVFLRHRRGYPRNHVRVSAESSKGVHGIVQGCPRNREWVSAES